MELDTDRLQATLVVGGEVGVEVGEVQARSDNHLGEGERGRPWAMASRRGCYTGSDPGQPTDRADRVHADAAIAGVIVGAPCSAQPQPGSPWCLWHDPAREAERATWRRQGGRGKANVVRAAKRLPQDVKDTLGVLLRTLGRLEADEIEPGRAHAIASVARAIVTAHETASLEARLEALEAAVGAQKGRTG